MIEALQSTGNEGYREGYEKGQKLTGLINEWSAQWKERGGGTPEEALSDAKAFFASRYPEEIVIQVDEEGYVHIEAQTAPGATIYIDSKNNTIEIRKRLEYGEEET